MPFVLNVALETSEFEFANVTVPGPLAMLQLVCRVEPAGSPSSLAWPCSVATPGIPATNTSGPAETTGGAFVFSGHFAHVKVSGRAHHIGSKIHDGIQDAVDVRLGDAQSATVGKSEVVPPV